MARKPSRIAKYPANPSKARQHFIDHEKAERAYDVWQSDLFERARQAGERARRAYIEQHSAEQKTKSSGAQAHNDALVSMIRESIPRVMRILGGPVSLARLRDLAEENVEPRDDEVNAWQVCEAVMRDLDFGEVTEEQEKKFRSLFDDACRLLTPNSDDIAREARA